MTRQVVIDTDTAGDDTQALVLAALSDRVTIEAVTIAAGNVPFDAQVRNATYTLATADTRVPVYEGAQSPLVREFDHAEYVHGEGGLGGEFDPKPGFAPSEGFAPDEIVRLARDQPGELTLVCLAPLTNVALALQREPALGELLEEVIVMGGAANCAGNVTSAAEYNFWVDPDAARVTMDALDVTLVDWGVTRRDATFGTETLSAIAAAREESRFADFFTTITESVRAFNRAESGRDVTTQPDSVTLATLIEPSLVESTATVGVTVDDREGLTRGYSATDESGQTRLVESVDAAGFRRLFCDAVIHGDPERSLG